MKPGDTFVYFASRSFRGTLVPGKRNQRCNNVSNCQCRRGSRLWALRVYFKQLASTYQWPPMSYAGYRASGNLTAPLTSPYAHISRRFSTLAPVPYIDLPIHCRWLSYLSIHAHLDHEFLSSSISEKYSPERLLNSWGHSRSQFLHLTRYCSYSADCRSVWLWQVASLIGIFCGTEHTTWFLVLTISKEVCQGFLL